MGQAAGVFSLLRVPSATHSPAASHTAEQPVQRTHPSRMPTDLFHNSPVRPFRAHGTVHRLRASKAIGAPIVSLYLDWAVVLVTNELQQRQRCG